MATMKKPERILHIVLLAVTAVCLVYIYAIRQWPTPTSVQLVFWLLFVFSITRIYTDRRQKRSE